jgi:L-ascorbate metabolism protein UlaG (beta-lactamase superfamily)
MGVRRGVIRFWGGVSLGVLTTLVLALMVRPAATQEVGQATPADIPRVSIEYVAHASFIVESPAGTRLLLDPYADRVWLGYDFPSDWEADGVVITHPHYDHDGGEFRGTEVPWTSGDLVFRDPGRFRVADIGLLGVRGKHVDPYGKEFGQRNTIWVLEIDGLRVVHFGDNGPLTQEVVQALGRVDVLLMPADGDEHILSFDEIDEVIRQVKPGVVIPMHYRIPELEPGDGPSDLGAVGPWLARQQGVVRVPGNVWNTEELATLPMGSIVVLRHSPAVSRPIG